MAAYNQRWALAKAVEACGDMAGVLLGAAGVSGRAVMAHSTAGVVISRSGGQILNLTLAPSPSDPVRTLLFSSASDVHKTLGDGVKRYVIFLNNLLKSVKPNSAHQLALKLMVFETKLQECFSTITCDCVLTDSTMRNVIQTFFSTRFTSVVSNTLSKLVFEWVSKLETVSDISSLLCNFETLCIKFYPFPLFASVVQDGVFLKGIHLRRLPHNAKSCNVKVYYHSLETTPDIGEVEVDILEIVEEIDGDLSTLFVTNIFIEDRALFLLNCKNIFVIHSVCTDSVKYLFERTVGSRQLIFEFRYISEFLWLSLEGVSQMLVKAPNATIAAEYAEGILDCLKMLHFSFKESSCIVPAGGRFEHAVARKLLALTSGVRPRLPPVACRDQILSWKPDLSTESNLLRHINFATFEHTDSEVVDMISRALLSMPSVQSEPECTEPLVLKLAVLSKAVSTLIGLLKLDAVIIKSMRGRLM